MQHGKHNLVSPLRTFTRNALQQSLIASYVVFSLLLPTPAQAVQMGTLKQNSGFKVVVLAIANVNFAMKQAAENPMDGWRRQNVAHAMALLPPAIVMLAKEFKQNKLHDGDLPFVQSILGGYIDKGFVGKMESFSKNPTKENIPALGANFPKEALQQAEKSYIRMDEGKEGNGPSVSEDDAAPKDSGVSSAQLASLDSLENVFGKSLKKGEVKGKANNANIRMDEGAAGDLNSSGAGDSWDPKADLGKKEKAVNDGKFRDEISKEIDSAEQKLSQSTIRKPASVKDDSDGEKEEDSFFKAKKKSSGKSDKSEGLRGKKAKRHPVGDKTSFLNHSRLHPVAYVINGILGTIQLALADPAPAPGTPAAGPAGGQPGGQQGQGGQCGECGGGGGGGGGSGAKASDILMGLAMMMAAAAPMVAAAITADADKQIARMNSQTQITLATMTAQSARYMADNQKALAEFQAQKTEEIADKKNEKDLTVLREQLASMKYSQDQQRQAEREKRDLEDKYNQQRIELAQRQADDNLDVARQTLAAQLTQSGLSTGFKTTRDSSTRLDVNRLGGNAQLASTGFSGNAGSSVGSTLTGTGASTGAAGGGLASQLGTMGGASGGAQAVGLMSAARGRLLNSATLTMADSKNAKVLDPKSGAWLSPTKATGVKGVLSVNSKAYNNGTATLAQGSTRGFHQSSPKQGGSDVNNFLALNTAESDPNSFSSYRNGLKAAVPVVPGSAHSPSSTGAEYSRVRGIRATTSQYEGGGHNSPSLGALRIR